MENEIMVIEFENEFVRFWSEEESPILYSVLHRMPADEKAFLLICERYVEWVKSFASKFKGIYSITDMTTVNSPNLTLVVRFYEEFIPLQKGFGMKFKAFVKPKNIFAQFSLEEIIANTDRATLQAFNSFEEAIAKVKSVIEADEKQIQRGIL